MPIQEGLTAEQILAIPAAEPERLFSAPERAGAEFRALAKTWHPDRRRPGGDAGDDAAVFRHLLALWQAARARIAAGAWSAPDTLVMTARDGRRYRFRHRRRHGFELGEMLIGRSALAFRIEARYQALFESAWRTMSGLVFAGSAMRAEFEAALPRVRARFETAEHHVLVVDKAADLVALADAQDRLGGRIDARSAAWILSGLHNLACYLEWAGLAHMAIDRRAVFISPQRHAAALLGGWWYAAAEGRRIAALPRRSVDVMPPDLRSARTAGGRLDLELIRLTGRELLGDPTGVSLLTRADVPGALAAWLIHPAAGSAIDDYERWQTVLDESFGPRRFTPMKLSADEVYGN